MMAYTMIRGVIEYFLCYAGAFGLGFCTALVLVYVIAKLTYS